MSCGSENVLLYLLLASNEAAFSPLSPKPTAYSDQYPIRLQSTTTIGPINAYICGSSHSLLLLPPHADVACRPTAFPSPWTHSKDAWDHLESSCVYRQEEESNWMTVLRLCLMLCRRSSKMCKVTQWHDLELDEPNVAVIIGLYRG